MLLIDGCLRRGLTSPASQASTTSMAHGHQVPSRRDLVLHPGSADRHELWFGRSYSCHSHPERPKRGTHAPVPPQHFLACGLSCDVHVLRVPSAAADVRHMREPREQTVTRLDGETSAHLIVGRASATVRCSAQAQRGEEVPVVSTRRSTSSVSNRRSDGSFFLAHPRTSSVTGVETVGAGIARTE